jgi:hypothetical protein
VNRNTPRHFPDGCKYCALPRNESRIIEHERRRFEVGGYNCHISKSKQKSAENGYRFNNCFLEYRLELFTGQLLLYKTKGVSLMSSQKRIKANQANALKSTGAKTPKGKLVVAGNALKHGLLSNRLVLEGESHEDYQ